MFVVYANFLSLFTQIYTKFVVVVVPLLLKKDLHV